MAPARITLTDDIRFRIAAARRAKNLSRKSMAEMLGIGYMTLVRTELGDRSDARKELRRVDLEEIARLTDQPLEYFTEAPARSQLDRIEAKLDSLLEILSEEPEAEVSPSTGDRRPKRLRPSSTPQAPAEPQTPPAASGQARSQRGKR